MGKKVRGSKSALFCLLYVLLPSLAFSQCPSSVGITSDKGLNICENTSVTFTANPTGGTSLQYQWQVNDENVGTNNTYTSSSLSNGDIIKVIVTSADDASCPVSKSVTMTVNAVRTPTVSLTSSRTSICPGESITFTAANTNGGS